jgi:replication-associated recombination protein RarA
MARVGNGFELRHVHRYIEAVPGVEVLVLHGPPGSGKTTLSRVIAEVLRLPTALAADMRDRSI